MDGGEMARLPVAGIARAGPDGGRRAVAEEAEADEDAGVVVGEKCGGADFHRDGCDHGLRVGC